MTAGEHGADPQALRQRLREVASFLAVGLGQFATTFVVYLVCLRAMPWHWALLWSLAVGILFQTVLQIRATFRRSLTLRAAWPYATYQLVYTGFVMVGNWIAISLGVPEAGSPILVMTIVTPINYILSRSIVFTASPDR